MDYGRSCVYKIQRQILLLTFEIVESEVYAKLVLLIVVARVSILGSTLELISSRFQFHKMGRPREREIYSLIILLNM